MARAGALHGDERVEPADVGEERETRVRGAARGASAVDALPLDERELHHARRR